MRIFDMNLMRKYGVLCMLFFAAVAQGQQTLTLEDCRRMAMENNKGLLMSEEKVKAAKSMEKAAKTHYLPSISAKGGYMYNSRNISLLGSDQMLPVGSKMADGSFGFTPDQISNQWTMLPNGQAVPLDANGMPFDPAANPEKIQWKNYAYIPKDAFEFDIKHLFFGGINASMPIYLGGKIREMNRLAKTSREIAENQLDEAASEVLFHIDERYWQVVSLSAKKSLAESYVQLLRKLDDDLEKSIAVGVATVSDGLTVKVKLNEAEMTLSQVDDGLQLSKMALAQLCGIGYDVAFTLADEKTEMTDLKDFVSVDTEVNMENALSSRKEVQNLELLGKVARSNEKLQLSRFMPSVAAVGGYNISNPNLFNGVDNGFAGMWIVGVAVNVPIFHWGERFHTLSAARSEKKIVQYQLDEAREKIELQITQAKFKIDEAQKRLATTMKNLERAEENLQHADVGFEAGVITVSNVLEAQTAWLKAKSENIDAQVDIKLCNVYLKKAIGQLSQEN
ncbi:MAG: TolC family protein [Bacteroidales bacterium]|nr:TolC family protein [Bacteroidales bacterium]